MVPVRMTGPPEGYIVGRIRIDDWMDDVDDDEYALLGRRFSRADERQKRRRATDGEWQKERHEVPRKKSRPEPYRDRFY